mmetsp:Transcript_102362/g.285208  ORF Transcript_102362/g.285208 Transcript_102362/m.285208 type:complete len:148 (-) Transcript_102362:211-654(-)
MPLPVKQLAAKGEKQAIDLAALERTLEKWTNAKQRSEEAWKEIERSAAKKRADAAGAVIETCKSDVEAVMTKAGLDVVTTAKYEVKKSVRRRESCSKQDLPKSIWEQYAKTTEYVVLLLKELSKAKAKAKTTGKVSTKSAKAKKAKQ